MDKLRVFISSTCYDLSKERSFLRKSIKNMGYEPICSEYNDICYGPDEHTYVSCIKEVDNSDFFVYIIGGRYGGAASKKVVAMLPNRNDYKGDEISITQAECMRAIYKHIPRFVFIKESVLEDHKKFLDNKNKPQKPRFKSLKKQETANKIFDFFDFVRHAETNNAYFVFKDEKDILKTLKEQWGGLFKRYLDNRQANDAVNFPMDGNGDDYEKLKTYNNFYVEYLKLWDEINNFVIVPDSDWYENSPMFVYRAHAKRSAINELFKKYESFIPQNIGKLFYCVERLFSEYDSECRSIESSVANIEDERQRFQEEMEESDKAARDIADLLYGKLFSIKDKMKGYVEKLEKKL